MFKHGDNITLNNDFKNTAIGKQFIKQYSHLNKGFTSDRPVYVVDSSGSDGRIQLVGGGGTKFLDLAFEHVVDVDKPVQKFDIMPTNKDIFGPSQGYKYYVIVNSTIALVTADKFPAMTRAKNETDLGHTVVVVYGKDIAKTSTKTVTVLAEI